MLPLGAIRRPSADYVRGSLSGSPTSLLNVGTSPALRCAVSPANAVSPASSGLGGRTPAPMVLDASPRPPVPMDLSGAFFATQTPVKNETMDPSLFATPQRRQVRALPPRPPAHALPTTYPAAAVLSKRVSGETMVSEVAGLSATVPSAPSPKGSDCLVTGTERPPKLSEAMSATARNLSVSAAVSTGPTPARSQRASPVSSLRWLPAGVQAVAAGSGLSTAASLTSLTASSRPSASSPAAPPESRPGRRSSSVATLTPLLRLREGEAVGQQQQAADPAVANLWQTEKEKEKEKVPHLEQPFTWEIDKKSHPMVTDGEKAYVGLCLEQLSQVVKEEGGLLPFMRPQCPKRRQLMGPSRVTGDALAVLAPCLEAVLQQQARTGGDSVFIERGSIISLGGKKVLKVQIAWEHTEHTEHPVSICWDWDVKLEAKGSETEAC